MGYSAFPLGSNTVANQWITITISQTLVPGFGYFVDGAAQVTLLLPTVANEGDTYVVWDVGGHGFKITQNAAQQILCGAELTTVGTGGSVTSTSLGDKLYIVCDIANTDFAANPQFGSFNVV